MEYFKFVRIFENGSTYNTIEPSLPPADSNLHGSRLNSREFSFPEFPAKLIGTRNQTRLPDVIYPHDNYIASKEKETVRSDRGSTESRRQRERIVEGGGGGATAIDKPRSHVHYCDDNDDVSAFVITEPTAAL